VKESGKRGKKGGIMKNERGEIDRASEAEGA